MKIKESEGEVFIHDSFPHIKDKSPPHSSRKNHSKGSATFDFQKNSLEMSNQGLGLTHAIPFFPLLHQEIIS